MNRVIHITAKTRIELAAEYGISTRTLARWFKKYNLNFDSHMLMPIQVQKVYETFGYPKIFITLKGSVVVDVQNIT